MQNGHGCSSLKRVVVGVFGGLQPAEPSRRSATKTDGRIDAAADGLSNEFFVPLIGARDSLLPPPRDRDAPVGRHAVLTPFQDSCLGGRSAGLGRLEDRYLQASMDTPPDRPRFTWSFLSFSSARLLCCRLPSASALSPSPISPSLPSRRRYTPRSILGLTPFARAIWRVSRRCARPSRRMDGPPRGCCP